MYVHHYMYGLYNIVLTFICLIIVFSYRERCSVSCSVFDNCFLLQREMQRELQRV